MKNSKGINEKGRKPQLIVFAGCAASGKTSIARLVAKDKGALLVDKDDATRRFTDFVLELKGVSAQDRESKFYIDSVRSIEYDTMFALAEENLRLGNDVVVAAPFIHVIRDIETWREAGYPESNEEYDVVFIWIAHDIDLERSRMIERGALRDGNKLLNWKEYAESLSGIRPDEKFGPLVIENSQDSDPRVLADSIVDFVRMSRRRA